jgi:hypothetical protein
MPRTGVLAAMSVWYSSASSQSAARARKRKPATAPAKRIGVTRQAFIKLRLADTVSR